MKSDIIILTCVSENVPSRGIGAYRIADVIRRMGRSVQVIDFTDWFSDEELIKTITSLIGKNTKMIGISSSFYQEQVTNTDNKNKFIWLEKKIGLPSNIHTAISILKKQNRQIKFVIGGANSFLYENNLNFDAVFHSYSDTSIIDYINHLFDSNNNVSRQNNSRCIINGAKYHVNVETLEHSWADNDYIFSGESLPIEISRGCIFKCKFCNFQLTGKKKLDYIRQTSYLKTEFLENYEKFGTTNYTFTDDTFNDSTYKLELLHKVISQLPFKINFTTYLRLDLLEKHREQLDLLKDMGLRSAFFGIESFNEKTAKSMGKGMPANKIKDFLLEIKNDHFKDNFSMLCSFIVGLPYESTSSIEQSFKWIQDNDINSLWIPLFIRRDAIYKSDIDINYEKYGYTINKNNNWTNEFTNFFEATTLANRMLNETNNTINTWPLFSLASLKLWDINQMTSMRRKDLDLEFITKKRDQMIEQYKEKLNR